MSILSCKKYCKKCGVYFFTVKNFTKIGNAVDIAERYMDLQTGCPYKMKINGYIPLPNNKKILLNEEKTAHIYFHNYFHKGEWFKNISHLIKDYIKMRKKVLANQETDKEVI